MARNREGFTVSFPAARRGSAWRKRLWFVAGVVFLAVMYPVSYGPVTCAVHKHWLPPLAYRAYVPIWWLLPDQGPLTDVFLDYGLYFKLAARASE